MSYKIHKQLRESLSAIRKCGYTPAHVAVLECLAYRINDDTQTCFPSVATIGNESYLSERHARKILNRLSKDGIVEIIHFSRKSNRYKLHIPFGKSPENLSTNVETVAGDLGSDQVAEARLITSEARLTNNPNQSLNPISESSCLILNVPPSEILLTEKEVETRFPVQSSNQNPVANTEVLQLHAYLMKKVDSICPAPSAKDVKLLNEAVEQYGIADLYQLIEGVYRQKNKFWRGKLKSATHPCSMLCRSLSTIAKQLNEAEEQATVWAKKMALESNSKEMAVVARPQSQCDPAPEDSHDDVDDDFGSFELHDDEQ